MGEGQAWEAQSQGLYSLYCQGTETVQKPHACRCLQSDNLKQREGQHWPSTQTKQVGVGSEPHCNTLFSCLKLLHWTIKGALTISGCTQESRGGFTPKMNSSWKQVRISLPIRTFKVCPCPLVLSLCDYYGHSLTIGIISLLTESVPVIIVISSAARTKENTVSTRCFCCGAKSHPMQYSKLDKLKIEKAKVELIPPEMTECWEKTDFLTIKGS